MARKASKASGRGGARPGSGRPASDDPGVPVAARLPATLLAKLDARAEREGLTRSQAIAEAIRRMVGG